MTVKVVSEHCEVCGQRTAFQNPGISHPLHLLLSILTLGLWVPVWIVLGFRGGSPARYRCVQCGTPLTEAA